MKKRYVVIGLLAASLSLYGQRPDSTYRKKQLLKTDIQLLFSLYTQDNDHSPVTGGIGTEDLQVYSSQIAINFEKDSVKLFHFSGGLDVISSASTDNIDFEMSSASRTDYRGYFKFGYDYRIKGTNYTIGSSAGISIESDYRSLGPGLSISHTNPSRSREVSMQFQTYFDDLRWYDNGKWIILVYPEELRNKEWFDVYNRNSYNISVGFYQAINRKMSLGIYPGISYQDGLLSTPFHRVYFTDNSVRVENLPQHRMKIPIGVQLNSFIGSRFIVRTYYRYYWDDFGIRSHTLSVETPVKLTSAFTITPFFRVYRQTQSDYFKAYAMHEISAKYYASDYDLSAFNSIKVGLGVRHTCLSEANLRLFKVVELRYALYSRSDGLLAHVVSSFFNWNSEKPRKFKKM